MSKQFQVADDAPRRLHKNFFHLVKDPDKTVSICSKAPHFQPAAQKLVLSPYFWIFWPRVLRLIPRSRAASLWLPLVRLRMNWR